MTAQPDYYADLAATVAACADGGNDTKIVIPVQHARWMLEQMQALRAENAKLAKLNAAYWAEIQSYRRDAYCLNDEGKATDAARKEAGL